MSGEAYLIWAYVISLTLLWGYAALVWWGGRKLNRRAAGNQHDSTKERSS